MQVLDALNNSNERVGRITYKEFYNDAVNKELNLKDDFENWISSRDQNLDFRSPDGFSFAFYPWIFDSNTKSTFLQLENKYQMLEEIHNPINLIFMDIYAILEVNRHNLIEDTLVKILSGEINFKKPLRVVFEGEEGIDAGGVKKEYFQLIIKELFDPSFSMFKYYDTQRLY